MLERAAIPFSRGPFRLRGWTLASCIASRLFTLCATRLRCEVSWADINLLG